MVRQRLHDADAAGGRGQPRLAAVRAAPTGQAALPGGLAPGVDLLRRGACRAAALPAHAEAAGPHRAAAARVLPLTYQGRFCGDTVLPGSRSTASPSTSSMADSRSASRVTPAAFTFSVTCSGRLAPMIAAETLRFCSTHATAS